MSDLGPIGAARRAAAEREQRTRRPRKPLLTLSTPCAACPHPYNWHKADGCQAGDEEKRCGCLAFAVPAEHPPRHTVDTITSDALDALYEQLEQQTAKAGDCAEWFKEQRRRADRAQATLGRVHALAATWSASGPPPIGTSLARWCDRRLADLNAALEEPKEK